MVDPARLGQRLKEARERAGLTQDLAARDVGFTRGALAQIELGMRAPNSLQLARLADLYAQDPTQLLVGREEAPERDAVQALFRSETALADDPSRAEAVRHCALISREYTNLEALLGRSAERDYPVEYDIPGDGTRWDAIRQGERLAQAERDRLSLGDGPIKNIRDVLEPQGLRLMDISLPDNISGIFLNDPNFGLSIMVNHDHHPRRRLFSYAHEYCHALCDRGHPSMVSKRENREDTREIRANAFAAGFLMPEAGVRSLARALGKGGARSVLQVYDDSDDDAVAGQKRVAAGSQELQVYEVVQIAQHFGVSYDSMLYRLLNLGLVSKEDRARLADQRDLEASIRQLLHADDEETKAPIDSRQQFLLLGLEALRRNLISRRKLEEITELAGNPHGFQELIEDIIQREASGTDEVFLPTTEPAAS